MNKAHAIEPDKPRACAEPEISVGGLRYCLNARKVRPILLRPTGVQVLRDGKSGVKSNQRLRRDDE